jgi:hypothetical protein
MTINCTETPFTCYSQIHIIGIELQGIPWFVGMLLIAFALQVVANFIWLQVSQVSRVLLQYKKTVVRRGKLICKSVGWTALGTTIGILRVIFIIGNNLWLYIVILAGDIVGTAAASYVQSQDEDVQDEDVQSKGVQSKDELDVSIKLDVIIRHLEDPTCTAKKKKMVQLLMPHTSSTEKSLFL